MDPLEILQAAQSANAAVMELEKARRPELACELVNRALETRAAANALIDSLDDNRRRGILREHYLLGLTMQRIAKDSRFTKVYIHAMHRDALSQLRKKRGA